MPAPRPIRIPRPAAQRAVLSVAKAVFRKARSLGTGLPALFLALGLGLALPAQADKPDWAGGGKKEHREKDAGGRDGGDHHGGGQAWQRGIAAPVGGPRVEIRIGGYFGESHRVAVHRAYATQWRAGHCPPGLAKKGNGCQPPGQAGKAYAVGRPLPAGVVYHELPPSVTVQLGVPPAGHRFVRVAADILLIAVGTGMVIDAIEDLGR